MRNVKCLIALLGLALFVSQANGTIVSVSGPNSNLGTGPAIIAAPSDALDDIAGIFSKGVKQKNPDPDLGGLLGGNGLQAVSALSKQFNLKGDQIAQLIPMLSPLILGSLTKKRDAGGAGSSGVAALLDSDGDGSILDDVAGFLMKGQGGKKGSGLLGSLVGGLLRRKR